MYKLFNYYNYKFILWLWKSFYPYEYVDNWERFNEASLPEKEDFYSYLKLEDNTGADYTQRVCEDFEIKTLGEYHDLYF